ncbi:hypothetical protein L2719_12660 [Shewanella schlegeliana]|uniref:Uncharacterized protein n=1 Tax=Shewanella schlegeliana TaxID=190308 RepID=A0ABS1T284_9GAMM|nr:hypothetical protein [Shewanella schlegeliana]MBL4914910.1 hypothetical protein [Shewanella schlegeliana]MCL1110399.1 hypothetical protein [Shewanella schlegeliana]GIU27837.1 hypothetical protein TUM4433_15330 [Shewanella schlegeliana]
MRTCLLMLAFSVLCLFIGYHAYLFIMPSVKVINQSGQLLTRVEVSLPSNNLVFDNIGPKQTMRIHHSTEQADGDYAYRIRLSSGAYINGRCGYVTHDQYMKVLKLTINNDDQVSCIE